MRGGQQVISIAVNQLTAYTGGPFNYDVYSCVDPAFAIVIDPSYIKIVSTGASGALSIAGQYIATAIVPPGDVYVAASSWPTGAYSSTVTIIGNVDIPSIGITDTVSVPTTAGQLPANPLLVGTIVLRAPLSNTVPVMWGYTSSIGNSIATSNHASFIWPGGAAALNANDTSAVWIRAASSGNTLVYEAQ